MYIRGAVAAAAKKNAAAMLVGIQMRAYKSTERRNIIIGIIYNYRKQ